MNKEHLDNPPNAEELSGTLRCAVDAIRAVPPPDADFEAWQRGYAQAMAFHDSQRTILLTKRKMTMRRLATLAAVAVVLACVCLGVFNTNTSGPGTNAFAQTVEQIQKARTITWKTIFYEHITSKDEKTTWLHSGVIENAYKASGLQREVRLDDQGQVESVEVTDPVHGRQMIYYPRQKKATVKEITPGADVVGPFVYFEKKLNEPNLQWIGKRKTATGEANVFRHTYRWYVGGERDWSIDLWIDVKTKQLVAAYQPGADVYDPENDPARNIPPGDPNATSMHRIMGDGTVDIAYDVELDDALFSLEPPEGYAVEVKKQDHITEKEMIDYWGIVADFNDQTFPDKANTPWNILDKISLAQKKPQNEQAPAERKLLDTDMRYGWRFGTMTNAPILAFFFWDSDTIVEKSFRYLGKGVKLGDKDRIVCWYKLKNGKDPTMYRVIYGDLSVKDVAAKDLPLPVEP